PTTRLEGSVRSAIVSAIRFANDHRSNRSAVAVAIGRSGEYVVVDPIEVSPYLKASRATRLGYHAPRADVLIHSTSCQATCEGRASRAYCRPALPLTSRITARLGRRGSRLLSTDMPSLGVDGIGSGLPEPLGAPRQHLG